MTHARPWFRYKSLIGLLLLPILAACGDSPTAVDVPAAQPEVSADGYGGGQGLRLMSRNVYLGGDVAPILEVDFTDIPAVTEAAAAIWASVQANRFPIRAKALAREIALRRPHFVGVQEAVRFITLDGNGTPTGSLDYLEILLSELQKKGAHYEVHVQENTHVTLPVALGPTGPTELLDFTDRIALLIRKDVTLDEVTSASYQARLELPPLELTRGWIKAEATVNKRRYRIINTHLEVQPLEPVQLGQTAELLGSVVGDFDGTTVLMGDLNSDAEAPPGAPSWTPTYGLLTDAGFSDLWEIAHPRRPVGFTCCFARDLTSTAESLDERIDFVLVRGVDLGRANVQMHRTGHRRVNRIRRLWPSDHAGLFARINPPPPWATW